MKTRFIPALVTLLAAAILSIINIINKVELKIGLRNLLIVIIVFYIVGQIAKVVIHHSIQQTKEETLIEEATLEDTISKEDSSTTDKTDELV